MIEDYYHNCVICGKKELAFYLEETRQKLIEKQYCFHCNFWDEILQEINNGSKTRIITPFLNSTDHMVYNISPESPSIETINTEQTKPFSGQFHIFKKNDIFIYSTNVWVNGRIGMGHPFRYKLCVNVDEIDDEERKDLLNNPNIYKILIKDLWYNVLVTPIIGKKSEYTVLDRYDVWNK